MTDRKEIVPSDGQQESRQSPARDNLLNLMHVYRRYIIGALLGVLVACLFMWQGFWRTLFILVMATAGAFLFGVDEKAEWLKKVVNKLFPPKG